MSTAIVGLLKASFKTTLAVFLPTPGNLIRSLNELGTIFLYFLFKILHVLIIFFAFVL